jgi:hypothetical protein
MSRPQDHSAAGRTRSIKSSSGIIGNRTHDFPVCSVVPQASTPLRAPKIDTGLVINVNFGAFQVIQHKLRA